MKSMALIYCLFSTFSSSILYTEAEKCQFVDFYRTETRMLTEFPDAPPDVYVLFFDLNKDGSPEAITSDETPDSGDHSHTRWFVYSYENLQWKLAKMKMKGLNAVDTISVISTYYCDDFYALKEPEKPDRLIVIFPRAIGKDANDDPVYEKKISEATIDSEGYLLNQPLEDLDALLNDPEHPRELVPLKVEVFKDVPAYKPEEAKSSVSTNQTITVQGVSQ